MGRTLPASPNSAKGALQRAERSKLKQKDTHHSAHAAGQREGGERAGVHTIGVQVANVDLHARMVLGRDQLVGPRAAHTAALPVSHS